MGVGRRMSHLETDYGILTLNLLCLEKSHSLSLSLSQFMIPKHEYKNIASNNDNGVQYTQQMKKEPHTEWTRYVRLNLFHTNFVLSILVYATNHWKWDR